ncbi:flagellar hook-associated protein 2 [Desulfuromusa kysingii]|uniref:Flagellar hook-associated protein 2 n=1 Tax=Desulfuromusa kysingii TaxID=37625 RepID=A0A1H3VMQ1_9BACT|nr:flagellar filament capping protein FliD [Desulfuromusa kysingii]SDZ76060.1 flagellar hook-associated protein 2 [Desulfuromusa kysingii]
MSITFGGLATGLDTNAIIDQLMEIERQPVERLESDRSWFTTRQDAYTTFDTKLTNFLSRIEDLGSSEDLLKKSVTSTSEDFFSVSADTDALAGTSYQVEVVSLAQVQKNVSQGYADKSAHGFSLGELTLTVGDNEAVSITIDETNNSLEGVVQAINDADAGVNASIINDGTDSPYRLVLTGENVASGFTLTSALSNYDGDISSQLESGGFSDQDAEIFGNGTLTLSTGDIITLSDTTNSLTSIMEAINAETATTGVTASVVADGDNYVISLSGDETIAATALTDSNYSPFNLIETQAATQAHVRVDSIDIYSDDNMLTEAIPGLSLDLLEAEEGTTTVVSVGIDEIAIKSQIQSFVTGYNEVASFINSQSTINGSSGGILNGDSGVNVIKRRLQGLLTTTIDNSGSFAALSQLGLKTQQDGTLALDDEMLTDAIQNNLADVEKLLVGEGDNDGVAVKFQNYLEDITDSIDGVLAGTEKSTESNLKRIDNRIEQIEARLTSRETTMRQQYTALENIISGMNSQSSFLTQQMDMLNNMLTGNN